MAYKERIIGILRERKDPPDSRTPFTPAQLSQLSKQHPTLRIMVEASPTRCFSDEEYTQNGIEIVDDVRGCDVLFGIKEVPPSALQPGKTYFMFSHTIKKQEYNKKLLQTVLEKDIRLIDYECLVDSQGKRLIAFGRWAGVVGAYNALWTYGLKHSRYELPRAHTLGTLAKLLEAVRNLTLDGARLVLTGGGRVAAGSKEVLEAAGIANLSPQRYLDDVNASPVYTQIDADVYTKRKDGEPFSFEHFFKHPEEYENNFLPFAHKSNVLISAAFWHPKAPRLFEWSDIDDDNFSIDTIADITCDIDGSVPTTIRASTIADPVYDIDKGTQEERQPFSNPDNISVMAIDNLPNELPREASADFGQLLTEKILPLLLHDEPSEVIKNGTLARDGALTKPFEYLRDYTGG
jgi:alanine dehydrogenase